MSPLFPTPIPHTPPAHCVRVHRVVDGDEYKTESGKNIPLTLGRNIRLLQWLADARMRASVAIVEPIQGSLF